MVALEALEVLNSQGLIGILRFQKPFTLDSRENVRNELVNGMPEGALTIRGEGVVENDKLFMICE